MKYQDLSEEDKISLANATKEIRSRAGQLVRLVNALKIASAGLGSAYTRGLVSALDAGELIPNSTDYAGATSLIRERAIVLFELSDRVVELMTPEALAACVDAAGPANCQ